MTGAAKFLIGCAEVGEGGLVGLVEAQKWMHRKIGTGFVVVIVGLGEVEIGLD